MRYYENSIPDSIQNNEIVKAVAEHFPDGKWETVQMTAEEVARMKLASIEAGIDGALNELYWVMELAKLEGITWEDWALGIDWGFECLVTNWDYIREARLDTLVRLGFDSYAQRILWRLRKLALHAPSRSLRYFPKCRR